MRATPITHRDKTNVQVGSQIPRQTFDELEAVCRKRGITKAQFIRQVIEEKLFPEPRPLSDLTGLE